jgi:hypothetical protein
MESLQRPFGRTSTGDFQVALAAQFHCVVQAALPTYPHSRDAITVWTRTSIVDYAGGSGSSGAKGKGKAAADDMSYADIPEDERLPQDLAAPKYAHLI